MAAVKCKTHKRYLRNAHYSRTKKGSRGILSGMVIAKSKRGVFAKKAGKILFLEDGRRRRRRKGKSGGAWCHKDKWDVNAEEDEDVTKECC